MSFQIRELLNERRRLFRMISQINEEIEKSIKENIYKLEFKKLKSGKEEKRISK